MTQYSKVDHRPNFNPKEQNQDWQLDELLMHIETCYINKKGDEKCLRQFFGLGHIAFSSTAGKRLDDMFMWRPRKALPNFGRTQQSLWLSITN